MLETNIMKPKPGKFGANSSNAISVFLIPEVIIWSVFKTEKVQKEVVLTNIWQKDIRSEKKERCLCQEESAVSHIFSS